MLERRIPAAHVEQTTWSYALEAYSQLGQIDREVLLAKAQIGQRELFSENSVLRAQEPRVDAGVPN